MSLWKGIARHPARALPRPRASRKKAAPRQGNRFLSSDCDGARHGPAYFGVPCTASVTTARVRDGASISRNV